MLRIYIMSGYTKQEHRRAPAVALQAMTPSHKTAKTNSFKFPVGVKLHFQRLKREERFEQACQSRAAVFLAATARPLLGPAGLVVLIACACLTIAMFLEFGPPMSG
jgi:hypothetical protein